VNLNKKTMERNTRLVRVSSGEDVICNVISIEEDYVTVSDPIVAVPAGEGQIGFAPWSPLLRENEEVSIQMSHVVYISFANDNIKEQYEAIMGGSNVITPPEKKLIL
tara:strand:+ start:29 stop:349 length:321 start_codon:yes stop_codon:yes gene_type:complete